MIAHEQWLERAADSAEALLLAHRCPARITGGTVGPRVVRFDLHPAAGVRLASVRSLAADLAVGLRVAALRVAQDARGLYLEFANPHPQPVQLLELLRSSGDLPPATAALGLTAEGRPLLARLPAPDVAHILLAGTTGSGKSTLLRSMTASLVLHNPASHLGLVIIDPKGRTFPHGWTIPHLTRPLISAPVEAAEALLSLVRLMQLRDKARESLPYVVLVVDELADLVSECGEASALLTRLAQRGREAGIHLLVATQRPSAAVLSGLLRANFPLRLVGRVVSPEDARIAAGRGGTQAETLEGQGDFVAVTAGGAVLRFQAATITLPEVARATQSLPGEPALTLPAGVSEPAPAIAPDDLTVLTARLRPWWASQRQERGAKTRALRFLFGDDVPVGGSYWRLTEAAINRLEAETSTTTDLLPAPGALVDVLAQ